jgi:hypothetical protein
VGLDAWPPAGAEPGELPLKPAVVSVDPADPLPSLGGRRLLVEGVGADEGGGTVTVSLGDLCATVEPDQPLVALVAGSSFPSWPRPQRFGTQRLLDGSRLELTTATEPLVSCR